jgi:hypothetical protein
MLTFAPDTRLLRASLDQHVPRVSGARPHLPHVVENDVRAARVEIANPPRLRRGMLAEHRKHASIVTVQILARRRREVVAAAGKLKGGVGIEYPRDRRRDRERNLRVLPDPGDLGFPADAPRAAVLLPPSLRLAIVSHQRLFSRGPKSLANAAF